MNKITFTRYLPSIFKIHILNNSSIPDQTLRWPGMVQRGRVPGQEPRRAPS